jgi:hypothetical protein
MFPAGFERRSNGVRVLNQKFTECFLVTLYTNYGAHLQMTISIGKDSCHAPPTKQDRLDPFQEFLIGLPFDLLLPSAALVGSTEKPRYND